MKLICSHVCSDSESIFSPDSSIGFQTIYWMNAQCFFLFLTNLVRVYFPRHLVHTVQQILAVWYTTRGGLLYISTVSKCGCWAPMRRTLLNIIGKYINWIMLVIPFWQLCWLNNGSRVWFQSSLVQQYVPDMCTNIPVWIFSEKAGETLKWAFVLKCVCFFMTCFKMKPLKLANKCIKIVMSCSQNAEKGADGNE